MHVDFLDFMYLMQQVLFVDNMTALIYLTQLLPVEASHLEHTEHLLLFIEQCEIVGEQLYLKRVWEFLDHLKVEQIE